MSELEGRRDWTWQDNVTACAERLSQKIEEAFSFELRASLQFLPFKHKKSTQAQAEEQARVQCDILLDYLLGTVVAVAGNTISLDENFEEIFVGIIRDKFARVRKIHGSHRPS